MELPAESPGQVTEQRGSRGGPEGVQRGSRVDLAGARPVEPLAESPGQVDIRPERVRRVLNGMQNPIQSSAPGCHRSDRTFGHQAAVIKSHFWSSWRRV
eukprot:6159489-Pyramimonas_sp.AAC.1